MALKLRTWHAPLLFYAPSWNFHRTADGQRWRLMAWIGQRVFSLERN